MPALLDFIAKPRPTQRSTDLETSAVPLAAARSSRRWRHSREAIAPQQKRQFTLVAADGCVRVEGFEQWFDPADPMSCAIDILLRQDCDDADPLHAAALALGGLIWQDTGCQMQADAFHRLVWRQCLHHLIHPWAGLEHLLHAQRPPCAARAALADYSHDSTDAELDDARRLRQGLTASLGTSLGAFMDEYTAKLLAAGVPDHAMPMRELVGHRTVQALVAWIEMGVRYASVDQPSRRGLRQLFEQVTSAARVLRTLSLDWPALSQLVEIDYSLRSVTAGPRTVEQP